MPEESFYRCSQKTRYGKPAVVWRCKECMKAKRKAQYKADPQASHETVNAWRRANPEAARAIVTRSYEKNKEKYLPRYRAKRAELRVQVLCRYAPEGLLKCALCPESLHQLLVLDHIDGGGTAHRDEVTGHGDKFYKWIVAHGFPPGYRVLCHNCNFREHCRYNRVAFATKAWDPSHKVRVIGGKKYPVDLKKLAEATSKYNAAVKLECLVRYSSVVPSCACCGLDDTEVLSIDHIEGVGRRHRKETGDGSNFYRWLQKNDFPSGYRVLCLSCNFARGAYGTCPHESQVARLSAYRETGLARPVGGSSGERSLQLQSRAENQSMSENASGFSLK